MKEQRTGMSNQVIGGMALGLVILVVLALSLFGGGKKPAIDSPPTKSEPAPQAANADAFSLSNTSWETPAEQPTAIQNEQEAEQKRLMEEGRKRWQNLDIYRRDY